MRDEADSGLGWLAWAWRVRDLLGGDGRSRFRAANERNQTIRGESVGLWREREFIDGGGLAVVGFA